jgi:hypothetical protein
MAARSAVIVAAPALTCPPTAPPPHQNLSADVDEPSLFERFSRYGEVYQARVDEDDFGRRSGIVSSRPAARAMRSDMAQPQRTEASQALLADRPAPCTSSWPVCHPPSCPAPPTPKPPSPNLHPQNPTPKPPPPTPQVQFLDESAVHEALRAENGQMFAGSRMVVEPHLRAYSGGGGPGPGGMPPGGGGCVGGAAERRRGQRGRCVGSIPRVPPS